MRRNHRLLLMVCADTLVVSGVRVADLAAEETGCGVPGLEWFHVILRNDSVDGSWWRNKFSSQEIDIPTVSMHE